MADSTSRFKNALLVLYDQGGIILWISSTIEPYTVDNTIGHPAWEHLTGLDATICKAAILTCLTDSTPQRFEIAAQHVGRWDVQLWPVRCGKVRIVGLATQIPPLVLELTERQREICSLLAAGFTSKEIAHKLDIARETVDNHRAAVCRRIGILPASLPAWCGAHREWLASDGT